MTEVYYNVHICEAYMVCQRREQGKGIWSLHGCIYRIAIFPLEVDWQESGGWREC